VRGEAGLRADLASLAIPFAEHEHPAVYTVAESRALDAGIPGAHTKNLFLKDTAGAFWLLTCPPRRGSISSGCPKRSAASG
jgi:Ala-tRNA(Pro) deacylase